MSKIIRIQKEGPDQTLFLFGEFVASWNRNVSERVIIEYAIEEAVRIGRRQKQEEIKKVLGL